MHSLFLLVMLPGLMAQSNNNTNNNTMTESNDGNNTGAIVGSSWHRTTFRNCDRYVCT